MIVCLDSLRYLTCSYYDLYRDRPDLLSIIQDLINMVNQGLHDGVTVNDFRGILRRIKDVMILATTYKIFKRRRSVRRHYFDV